MKSIYKFVSTCMILVGSFSYAQTDCFPLKSPLDKLIFKPIKTGDINFGTDKILDAVRMNSFLISFNESFSQYSRTGDVPSQFVHTTDNIDPRFYTLVDELVRDSRNFENLRENIEKKLRLSQDQSETEALILFDYGVQIVEASRLYSSGSSLRWDCIGKIIGYTSANVMMDTSSSSDDLGHSGGGIAGGGCTPTFQLPIPRPCH